MKHSPILYLLLTLLFFNCNKEEGSEKIPDCITQKIAVIQKEEVRNPPAKVYRYTFEGKTVYFFPQYCCDFFSELYDDECTLICAPDGGIIGMGDGKCSGFFAERRNEILAWEDDRK